MPTPRFFDGRFGGFGGRFLRPSWGMITLLSPFVVGVK
jgi:hypothetical protein